MPFEIRVWDTWEGGELVHYAVSVKHMAVGRGPTAARALEGLIQGIRQREDERLNGTVDG